MCGAAPGQRREGEERFRKELIPSRNMKQLPGLCTGEKQLQGFLCSRYIKQDSAQGKQKQKALPLLVVFSQQIASVICVTKLTTVTATVRNEEMTGNTVITQGTVFLLKSFFLFISFFLNYQNKKFNIPKYKD